MEIPKVILEPWKTAVIIAKAALQNTWIKKTPTEIALTLPDTAPLSVMLRGQIIADSTFHYNLYKSLANPASDLPLISCMMVTKNRFEQAKVAIQCFQNQTYLNKELIIVDDDESERLSNYVNQLADQNIHYLHLKPENKTLGELRNLALANTTGSYVCQWDDDDLMHPLRLELQMAALQTYGADACFLQRWLMWWVSSRRLAISRNRIWEGSMLCRKEKLFLPTTHEKELPYPAQRSGEDTAVVNQILQNCQIAMLDLPQLYVYVIHHHNTFNETHFEQHWKHASARYERANYEEMVEKLAHSLPIVEYQRALGGNLTYKNL